MSDKGKTGRGEQQPRAPGDVHDVFEFAWFTQTFIMLLTSVDDEPSDGSGRSRSDFGGGGAG